jgi:hypothetical protein
VTNPFGRAVSQKPDAAGPTLDVAGKTLTQDVRDFCPFLGMNVMMTGRMIAPRITTNPSQPPMPIPEQIPVGHQCIRDQCQFWCAEDNGYCVILAGFAALPEIAQRLEPLGNVFGGGAKPKG